MKSSKYIVVIDLNCFNHVCIVILENKDGKLYSRGVAGEHDTKKINHRKSLVRKLYWN